MIFTEEELVYLATQRLGRMATVQHDGTLQVNPVAAYYNSTAQTLDIGGHNMAGSQKFRNVRDNGRVAIVFDDITSVRPWQVRCLEVRGTGEALADPGGSAARMPGAIIRIHPGRIISWGLGPDSG